MEKQLLTVNEACKKFGIGRDKLYELIRSQNDLPTIKIGSVTKINSILFSQWLDKVTEEKRVL